MLIQNPFQSLTCIPLSVPVIHQIQLFSKVREAYNRNKQWGLLSIIMAKPLFLLQSHKFSNDNITTVLVCSKCNQVFKKQFPLDLEWQITEFKCSVCDSSGEANLPYKYIKRRELLDEGLPDVEEESIGDDFEEIYWKFSKLGKLFNIFLTLNNSVKKSCRRNCQVHTMQFWEKNRNSTIY